MTKKYKNSYINVRDLIIIINKNSMKSKVKKDVKIALRISSGMSNELTQLAQKNRTSVSGVIRHSVNQFISKDKVA